MEAQNKIEKTQQLLLKEKIDGWLFYDFRRSNDLACKYLGIPDDQLLTRRFFYWVPAKGDPVKIVHGIESEALDHLPGKKLLYRTWRELEERVADVLRGKGVICMEYSPNNAIPYVSKVDGGTIEFVRQFVEKIVSSADLLQEYTCVWTQTQWESHQTAAKALDTTVAGAWKVIEKSLIAKQPMTEWEVQQWIVKDLERQGCIVEDLPICAVNANSANPHYVPTEKNSETIKRGDFILIDLWCKQKVARSVYADITRVGVAAVAPTEKQQKIFQIVKEARDAATAFVKKSFAEKRPVKGFEIDDVSRTVIRYAGFEQFFIHRTGHNIDEKDHGPGANIDNFETHDERKILHGTCFSIEPGIYLPGEFGVRLEYDLFIDWEGEVHVTGGIQNEIVVFSDLG